MTLPTPRFECPRVRPRPWSRFVLILLWACALVSACAQPAADPRMTPNSASPTHGISNITLETECSGCPTGQRLELHRDGRVMATTIGKARLGTADRIARSALPTRAFDALAQQLLTGGFFEMEAVYEETGLQDGAWATLTVVRNGSVRQVFRREDAGPAALKGFEAAINALQNRLAFVPDLP